MGADAGGDTPTDPVRAEAQRPGGGGRRPRPLSLSWWVEARDGRVVVGQVPNPALYVYLAAALVQWSGVWGSRHDPVLDGVRAGALLVWGLDELVRGANPFRRLLGVIVLTVQIIGLLG